MLNKKLSVLLLGISFLAAPTALANETLISKAKNEEKKF